jgi:hypothetical protein
MPKVNNHPMGENSPNLVTLLGRYIQQRVQFYLQENAGKIAALSPNENRLTRLGSFLDF